MDGRDMEKSMTAHATTNQRGKKKSAPTREETDVLEAFTMLPLGRIIVPVGEEACGRAVADIERAGIVGFDTESRPVFTKEALDDGPHIVQFSTQDHAYIFQLHRPECERAVITLLSSTQLLKAGFGLQSDMSHIVRRFGLQAQAVLDINTVFKLLGYKHSTGLRAAVGIVFNRRFHKSKRITTSNWAVRQLSDAQLVYAANDAYAALCVLSELNKTSGSWQHALPAPLAALLKSSMVCD